MAEEEDEKEDGVAFESVLDQPGPTECVAGPEEASVRPEELSAPAHETRWPAQSQIDEAFVAESLATPMADDGLPDHGVDGFDGGTHPFSIDHVVCIEDNRELVAVQVEEFGALPSARLLRESATYEDVRGKIVRLVDRGPATLLRVYGGDTMIVLSFQASYDATGQKVERESFAPDREKKIWQFDTSKRFGLVVIGRLADSTYDAIAGSVASLDPRVFAVVRYKRPRCRFYKRQMFANDEQKDPEQPGHRIIFRNCTHPARRSIGGASLGLENEAIYACDYREPRDLDSEQLIDALDLAKMRDRPDLVRVPLFGMAGDDVDLRPKKDDT